MPVAHQSDRNVQPTIQSPVVWLGSSQPSARPHEEFQDDIRVPAVQSHCKQTVCQFTENFRCVEAPSVVSSLLRTEKKLRLHFCSLSSKSIRAAFLPPRTSESNFLAAKTLLWGGVHRRCCHSTGIGRPIALSGWTTGCLRNGIAWNLHGVRTSASAHGKERHCQ